MESQLNFREAVYNLWIFLHKFCVFCFPAAIGAKICTEQRCIYEISQGPSDKTTYTWYISRQWERGEYGRMVKGKC